MVTLLDEVVNMPEILVISGDQSDIPLSPCLLYTLALDSHAVKKEL
jgi:hypothetical protein